MHTQHEVEELKPWKAYTITVLEVWLTICIATFSLGLYLTHLSGSLLPVTIFMGLLYLFIIILCIKRLIERLSVAALMILVPIAPLAVLLLVISILPILQQLQ